MTEGALGWITQLNSTKIDERRNLWRLDSELRYFDPILDELFVAPAGFVTNFATLYIVIFNRPLRIPFAYWLAADLGDAAATIHDMLYTLQPAGITRTMADGVFLRALRDCCVAPWRALLMWAGVRFFGWTVWNKVVRDKKRGVLKDPVEQTIF